MSLPEFDMGYMRFLDRTTILYGESGTGKSCVITDVLHTLKPHIEQIVVVSPTDRQNHTYDRGIVPLPCIHYTMLPKLLDDIWERQNALAAVYTRVNRIEIIKSLFNELKLSQATSVISEINRKLESYKEEVYAEELDEVSTKSKIDNLETEYNRLILLIYKHSINEHKNKLRDQVLTENEKYTLKYLNLNPRLVVIFDDCTDLIKKNRSHPVMQKLFYQGRWAFITALIACHNDKALDSELRKNAFINVFTSEKSARSYFKRGSNDFDKDEFKQAQAAIKCAFSPLLKYQKLIWVRMENKFYKATANIHENFRFGSPVIWEYCRKIQAEAGSVATDNKFMQDFD